MVVHDQGPITAPVGETQAHFTGIFKGTFVDQAGNSTEEFTAKLATDFKFDRKEGDSFVYTKSSRKLSPTIWANITKYEGEFALTTKGTFERSDKGKAITGTLIGSFTGTLSGVISPCTLDKKFAPFIPKIKC